MTCNCREPVDQWIADSSASIADRAERELEALVGVSSPSGDISGAQEAAAIAAALLPDGATVERVPCSSPDHAPDLLARVPGHRHAADPSARPSRHGRRPRPAPRAASAIPTTADRLYGSGTVDMKGGDVLALGVLRALSARPDLFAEIALLLVVDEEWRVGPFRHVDRFADFDACLCFEAGELDADGNDAVVVKRKAAGTVEVLAQGRSAHSGSAPDKGRNALLALAPRRPGDRRPARPAWRRSPHRRPDRRPQRRRVQRRPRGRAADRRRPRRSPRGLQPRAGRDPGRGRRRDAHRAPRARVARHGRSRGDRAAAGRRERAARAARHRRSARRCERRQPLRGDDPADRRRPRARAAGRRTTPASSSSPRRCGLAQRSPWRSRSPRCTPIPLSQ